MFDNKLFAEIANVISQVFNFLKAEGVSRGRALMFG